MAAEIFLPSSSISIGNKDYQWIDLGILDQPTQVIMLMRAHLKIFKKNSNFLIMAQLDPNQCAEVLAALPVFKSCDVESEHIISLNL